jgi:hypothetical protein
MNPSSNSGYGAGEQRPGYSPSGYGGGRQLPGYSPNDYSGSQNYPGSNYPPPYDSSGQAAQGQAAAGTHQQYQSPSGVSPYAYQSPATYAGQAIPGAHGRYAEPYQPARDPYASGQGSYPASRGSYTSDTGPYVSRHGFPSNPTPANSVYSSPPGVWPHANASQPLEYDYQWQSGSSSRSPRPAPDYRHQEYASYPVSENRQYPSSSDVGRDTNTSTARMPAAQARGGDPSADASNAIPVSNFVSGPFLRYRASIDLIVHSAANSSSFPLFKVLVSPGIFLQNQTVRARITTGAWVMGVIIGVAHLASRVTTVRLLNEIGLADLKLSNSSQATRTGSSLSRSRDA